MRDLAFYVDGLVEGRRGTLVQQQKDRSVWRVEEKGEVWFAKRGVTPKRRREIRRETENARAIHAASMGPEVLADGLHGDAAWIVTARARGTPLRQALHAWTPDERRRRLLGIGTDIRRLHESGVGFPDLTADHVFVGDESGVALIDTARLHRAPAPMSRERSAAALAALVFSLPWGIATRADVVRLLRAAGCGDLGVLVSRRIERLVDRTRWRHGAWGATREVIEALDAARGEDQSPVFDGLMDSRGMEVVRALPDRANRRLGTSEDGQPLFFVKVFPATKSGWSPAMRELAAIDLFQRAGILVNRLAAYAEDVDKGSMVAVKTARGEPLDDLLRRGVSVAERRALAVQSARIWRRMRECGLRHRDAYPCHLFVAPWDGEALRFELRFIDMTRAGKAPFPKERWFVKDAAALWHGLPRPPVTRTDAVRWLREYFRIERLDARAKRFARRVAAKERRIAARQARKAKR